MLDTSKGLGYLPRWLAGMSCYIAFGVGGLISSFTLLPLLKYWPGDANARIQRVQKAVHLMFRVFVRMLTWARVIRLDSHYCQQLQQAKGMVVIANHPTLIDVVVLISLMPNAGCIVKQGLWRNPFMRGVVSAAGYIPNRGAELLLADCREVLNRGTNLIIFPEGTRTVKGEVINDFARGAANIALRCHAELLPVVLKVSNAGLTKQDPWYEIPRRTMHIQVQVGEHIETVTAVEDSSAKQARRLTHELEIYYRQQLDGNYELT
ncbi:lysophospholipid acyltransferase family protein [Shewanella sp. A32]|uniref:lysophospholipid acyltransferase family protein n=1 Tax=Shewanella sp. A32 TaxID=3031327 RepID=UPI0023B939B1|nr:lysophospholipid acyltransferase family protein [Shewanella sp. A32]MDF0533319.1 lysophospholipid acyltransferase family protein [Shewanella sp. A32]